MWGNTGSTDFGGGGFMASPGPGGPSGEDKAHVRTRKSNNFMPVTVKQLLECPDETFKIEDIEAHIVTIVGVVRKVETSTTKFTISIDDNTGVIDAISYVGPDTENSAPPTILVEGTYGRIVGGLRSQKGSKYINIYKSFPVMDLNEVTCHHLEVLQVPQKLKKLKQQEAMSTGVGGGGGFNNTFNNTSMMGGFGGGIGAPPAAPSTGMGGVINGLTAGQNKVFNYLKKSVNDDGVHRADIQRYTGLPEKEVNSIIDFLSGEGHIFTTIDDDHFKVTDW